MTASELKELQAAHKDSTTQEVMKNVLLELEEQITCPHKSYLTSFIPTSSLSYCENKLKELGYSIEQLPVDRDQLLNEIPIKISWR